MATMKLRVRSLESKQTLKIEIPTPSTLQQLKQTLSQSISSSASSSSSIHLSLNRKDELHASSPESSLQSLGITSGDLIFFTLNPTGFSSSSQILAPNSISNSNSVQQPSQTMAPNFPNLENPSEIPRESQTLEEIPKNQDTPVADLSVQGPEIADSDMSDSKIFQEQDGSVVLNSENEGALEFSGAGTMGADDGSVSMGKKFSERCFLRRVLGKELRDYGGDHRLLVIAVHAVLLESGFVGFDSVTGMRVDRFHLADEWPSKAFTVSLWYTLPELLGRNDNFNFGNVVESVLLKFQSLGHLITIYGSLAKGGSGLYRVCLNENKFVPAISLANSDSVDSDSIMEEDGYPEREIFEFWKIVKDGLVLPLLIDLCEKAGLSPPPCFMRLPAELKLKILESLGGVDLAKVGCVCSELRYLSSNDELWKRKYNKEFRGEAGAAGAQVSVPWKYRFRWLWECEKKRKKREVGPYRGFRQWHPLKKENPFGAPMLRRDRDRILGLGFGTSIRIQRLSFWPHCRLGGSNV